MVLAPLQFTRCFPTVRAAMGHVGYTGPMRPLPWPVVLASASPRRRELLQTVIPDFTVVPADLDEDALTSDDPFQTAQRLSREKALAVAELHPDSLVIGGDTVVALPIESGWMQLTKPTSEPDALRILQTLAERTHHVITGVCLRWPAGLTSFTENSLVTFRRLTDQEIKDYIATGEPMDKAGAYGLQGGAKGFVERIEGSVTNVIGLPMERLEEFLQSLR